MQGMKMGSWGDQAQNKILSSFLNITSAITTFLQLKIKKINYYKIMSQEESQLGPRSILGRILSHCSELIQHSYSPHTYSQHNLSKAYYPIITELMEKGTDLFFPISSSAQHHQRKLTEEKNSRVQCRSFSLEISGCQTPFLYSFPVS